MAIAVPAQPSAKISASEAGVDLAWLANRIEYRQFQDCVHCGLCTASCPTYVETGDENDSPRGRIYLMRAVVDGRTAVTKEVRRHLDLCLDCRACESACPSGVQYGHLIEPFKVALQSSAPVTERTGFLEKLILHNLFPYASRVRLALTPARWMQALGLIDFAAKTGLTRLLPTTLQRMQAMLPKLSKPSGVRPSEFPPVGIKRARVALFTGCVADAMYPDTTDATARVLQHNGCEVVIPVGQGCCGAIHYHSGSEKPAIDFARMNLQAFNKLDVDAIIVNVAGCGAMLKEYNHLLPESDQVEAKTFVSKVKDISEFLVNLGPIEPRNSIDVTLTYHDACHLCHGQQIRSQPRKLLAQIPSVKLVPLEESELCCGAAGTYNLTQPEMSERLGRRKMENIAATGASIVATGNVGCILQIARKIKETGAHMECVHPVDLLDKAYGPVPQKD